MTFPVVSVIMPVFNGESYVAQAIESVLCQTYPHYEILIVDDGSRDGSAAILDRFQKQNPEKIRVFRHDRGKNRGVAFSRNLAVGHARGTYLAFLDQDDLWLPEKLERQVDFMERNPEIGLTYTRAEILRQGGEHQFMPGIEQLGDEPPDDLQSTLYKVVAVELNYVFSAVLVRTEDVRLAGGFPEDMLFQSDDRVLVAKVAARRRLGLLPDSLCCFRAHDDHYTQGVLQAGIASIVFFDLQHHVARWLLANSMWAWARDISFYMMPRFYADAVFRLEQMELFMLWHGLFGWTGRKKGSLPEICRRGLKIRLLWRWRDPLREHLLYQRNFPAPAGSPAVGSENPLVSVVIPAFNAGKYLAQTLESVVSQTYPHYEILLVDDGSRDDTPGIAQRFAAEHPGKIRLLTHPGGANRGVAASRNLALSQARGAYVAFLDADDAWLPEKLTQQVRYMQENPGIGLSYTDATILREGDGHLFLPGIEVLGHEPPAEPRNAIVGVLNLQTNYIFSTVMVRTEVIGSVGGFLEQLPFQSEDRIMVAMVSSMHKLGRLPQILAHYRAHSDSYSASVVKSKTANIIIFDMQVKLICWLLGTGRRELGINLAARLIPGSLLRSLPRLSAKTLGPWLRDVASLAWQLPHLPLIVVLFHLTERARRWGGGHADL